MGPRYMAGTKRRMFLPQPKELRRSYGENAAAASIYGSLRPPMYTVMALMVIVVVVVAVASGSGPALNEPSNRPAEVSITCRRCEG